jgi:antitoxin (DNA-binding transcriptional repressor) of toxin-antitoxin stability system
MTIVDEAEVKNSIGRLLDSVAGGEDFRIVRDGKVIARLLPEQSPENPPLPPAMPDLRGRLARMFPDGPLAENYGSQWVIDSRD